MTAATLARPFSGPASISIRLALFLGIGLLAALLVFGTAQRFRDALRELDNAETAARISDCTDLLMQAAAAWALERGTVIKALEAERPLRPEERALIGDNRRLSDELLTHLKAHQRSFTPLHNGAEMLVEAVFDAHAPVDALRRELERAAAEGIIAANVPPGTWFAATTALIRTVHQLSLALKDRVDSDSVLAVTMRLRAVAWELSEFAGRERALISGIVAGQRVPTAEEFEQIGHYRGHLDSALEDVARIIGMPQLDPALKEALLQVREAYGSELTDHRQRIRPALLSGQAPPAAADIWFDAITRVIDTAIELQRLTSEASQQEARRQFADHYRGAHLELAVLVVAIALGAASLLFVMLRVVRPIQRVTVAFGRLAAGDDDVEIPATARRDEIGTMTRAIRAFRENVIERRHLEKEVRNRRRIEAELRQAKEAAEAASAAKTRFLANVSHELRTPLNAILGFAEVLGRGYLGPLNERQKEYIGDIHASGSHLLALIEDVLDISKAEAEEWQLDEQVVDPNSLAEQALSFVAGMAQKRDITLDLAKGAGDLHLRADGRMVVQMLTNLLSNAVKFTLPGGKVGVAVTARDDGGLRLVVRDNGVGMTQDEIATALELFGQVARTAAISPQGTGLGLPLVQRLCELHGAALHVESAPDVGTTVTIDLPPSRTVRQASS